MIEESQTINIENPPFGEILVTENQRKVIKDKYMKNDKTIEDWLWRVAKNIALTELLYHPDISREKILSGVEYEQEWIEINENEKTELLLIHNKTKTYHELCKNHQIFISNLYSTTEKSQKAREIVRETALKFYDMLANFDFLPNSPTLMNAGRQLQQLSACYVLPIEDSIESWGAVVKNTMIIHKSGGGTGFSVCRVRPKGDAVKTTKGIASGPLSPLKIINRATEEVKQGGTRRGANMGILPIWHPDIEEFINAKKKEGELENFNLSVAINEKFMEAVKKEEEYPLINPKNKEITKTINAKELFKKICENAWETGDPGIIWIDKINNSLSNPTPELGMIESTNPCGEQPLLPYEPCNLGSINLSKFAVMGKIDYSRLGETVKIAIHFLDNVIDVNNYPIAEIERMAKGNRRIGLGVMGWAEMLALLKIPYNSEEAIKKAEEIMKFINEKAIQASEELALQRGVFPFFKNSIYDETGKNKKEYAEGRPRNAARTTIAPTGTIAIASGLQGSGIEPFFSIVYTRYNAKAIDAIKKGEKPKEEDTFFEINPIFRKTAEENNFFGMKSEELWKKIEENHNSVKGITGIPNEIQKIFSSAHDIEIEYHIKMQASFQKHCDNAVSKTINLSNKAKIEDIEKSYWTAYETGCKGITIYRDGCKKIQILNKEKKSEKKTLEKQKIDYTQGVASIYYKFETGHGPVHVHIDHLEGEIFRVFTHTTPVGTEIAGLTSVLGIFISKYIENGGDINEIRSQLNSIKSDKPYGFGPKRIESIPHAISMALNKFLSQTGKIKGQQLLTPHVEENITEQTKEKKEEGTGHCPKCHSPNIFFASGCSGPTCLDCGHSECS
jgi:ribonucleoside-diphosphate reductase alpha chain